MSRTISSEREIPDMSYELIEANLKHIQGQILTLVEAVIANEESKKATKSVIKGYFNDKLTHLFDLYGPEDKETPNYEQ